MSNQDFDPSSIDISNAINAQQQSAVGDVLTSADANPENAARASQLAGATGSPPGLVYDNLDTFDAQHKAALSAEIVKSNPFLQDYVNGNPLAAKVSNDDWGQLDKVTGGFLGPLKRPATLAAAAWKGFGEGFGQGGLGASWITAKEMDQHPLAAATYSVLGAPLEGLIRFGSGAITAVARVAESEATRAGMDPTTAKQHADNFIQMAGDPGLWASLGPVAEEIGQPFMAAAHNAALREAAKIEPYAREGKVPPPGVSPITDAMHVEQASIDSESLQAALKESVASATRERSPELYSKLMEQVVGDQQIGVSADAVRALYGDKVPAPDDGVLGWVPGIQEQLQTAEATGGDIQVPLKDWLAKVEPEVARELQDHVRVRPEGLTVEEAKQPIEEQPKIDAYHGTPAEFDAFDSQYMGSGEGAQAYAYGHYVAEAPEVAESYKTAGTGYGISVQGKLYPIASQAAEAIAGTDIEIKYPVQFALQRIISDGFTVDKAIADMREQYPQFPPDKINQAAKILSESNPTPRIPGNLLGVRIKQPKEAFLDWDADMDAQPAGQKILSSMDPAFKEHLEDELDQHGQPALNTLTGEMFHRLLERVASEEELPGVDASKHGTDDHFKRQASEYIKNLGVPGVKFLDQASRKAGEGTRNFVVFNDHDLEVVTRNGEAVNAVRKSANLDELKPTPDSMAKAKQLSLDLPDTTPLDQREAFEKANAIGMTVDQYNRYQKLIEQRAVEDATAASKRVLEAERKRQTAEWKANRVDMRKQVVDDFANTPELELHEMLSDGATKLRADSLTDEQKATFPKDWVAKNGIHPDDLATLLDDPDVVAKTQLLEAQRAASGMRTIDFRRRLIEAETDKRMEAKYGKLDENIINEAKDQVLSKTQEDLLHEEVMALASQAGAEFSIGKEELKGWTQQRFNDVAVKAVDSDKFLADAGRAGRNAEMALLKNDPAEAFRQKQRQYLSVMMAKAAREFEKTQAKFEGFAKRFSAREIASVEQEYTDRIHEIMSKLGLRVKRSPEDLQAALGRDGQTLAEFVDYKERHDLREVPVAEYLLDPAFRAKTDDLTTAQFNQLYSSLKALEENGRDEKSVYRAGEKEDFEAVRDKMIDSLQRFDKAERDIKGRKVEIAAGPRRVLRSFIASHLQIETILNRLDKWDIKGPWTQYLFRPLAEAANHEALLERKYSTALKDIADNVNLKDVIPDSPFQVPRSDTVAVMNRKNLRATMLNMGNESNFNKLASGYLRATEEIEPGENRLAAFKGQIQNWVNRHATKEDWDWAQKVWDMFSELKKESDIMYQNVAGIEPESLPVKPVETPHGTYKGGYYPLIRNEFYGENLKFDKADLEGQGYIRATTPAGYTKQRTGAIYPLELDLDALPGRLKQVIHDIAYRPAVIQAGKFVYDKKLMAEMKDRMGPEVANLFQPWLKDIANQQNFMVSKDMKEMSYWTNFIRQNVTTTLVGLNPSTFMKHTPTAMVSSMAEVGPAKFLNELRALTSINDHFGESNWQFAMKTSEELQRRQRNWLETLTGGVAQLEGKTTGKALAQHEYGEAFMSLRNTVSNLASKPVAIGDLISAVPTWLARYKAEMEDHGVHGDAVYAADKAVRQAHGSTGMPSKSSVARSKNLQWFTGFFTFFNDLLNRQIETVWKAGEIKGLVQEGQYGDAMQRAKEVTARLTAYVLMPALIEELVSPLASDQNESFGKRAAKGLAFTLGASWVGVRDVVNAVLNARDPSAGLVSTLYKSAPDLVRDLNAKQGVKPENILKHGAQLAGFLTGMVPAQVGRTAAGVERAATGKEKPKGPWGWLTLGRYGTTAKHSQTLQDWIRHH